jgi:hypothetical protein
MDSFMPYTDGFLGTCLVSILDAVAL